MLFVDISNETFLFTNKKAASSQSNLVTLHSLKATNTPNVYFNKFENITNKAASESEL